MDIEYDDVINEMYGDKENFKKILDSLKSTEKIKLIKKIIRKKKNNIYYLKNKNERIKKNKEYYNKNKKEIFEKNKEYRRNYYLSKKEKLNKIEEGEEGEEE